MNDALALRTCYWSEPAARAAFKRFMVAIFDLDFGRWEDAGYWDDAYTPFSYFVDGEVVASVCVYFLDFVIDGRKVRLAQISGVGTRPEFRRQGLNRRLTEIALKWAEGRHEGVFLFADAGAVPFYQACGFHSIEEYLATAKVEPVPARKGAVRLDPSSGTDRERICAYAAGRVSVSGRLGVLSTPLFMFHALYTLDDAIWEIPDMRCLVCFRRERDRLKVYDIVGAEIPDWKDIYAYLAEPTDRTVEFHFSPDRLGLKEWEEQRLEGNFPFTLGRFLVDRPIFPFTSRA